MILFMAAFNPFDKLKQSLSRTKDNILGRISKLVSRRKIDEDLLEEIEEILIEADVGVKATMRLVDSLRNKAREQDISEGEEIVALLKDEISRLLQQEPEPSENRSNGLQIWLIVGVNGVGKTTTIGKLAAHLSNSGKKVIIAACDTFRAAAIDQIAIWADRSRVDIVRSEEGADPASVAFDAAKAAQARGADYLLVDTAGRLHTKTHLMEELRKIKRVIAKASGDTPIFSKLIIDGSTGQNALSQVAVFNDAVGCDGLIVTKLDGTAKGGVILAIVEELKIPVDYIGVGEGIDDLVKFDATAFAEALFSK